MPVHSFASLSIKRTGETPHARLPASPSLSPGRHCPAPELLSALPPLLLTPAPLILFLAFPVPETDPPQDSHSRKMVLIKTIETQDGEVRWAPGP